MKKTSRHESGRIAAGLITVLVLVVLLGGVVWMYSSSRAASVRDTFRLVKDSSQDAATTTKVKTALLLSKHVSAFDTAVVTARGEVTLTGQVPTEDIKRLAAAIAQDTSGVTAVHNNLTVNPAVAGNPEVASIGDRVADLEIKTLVTDRLAQSPEVKDARITVQVSKRRVSLEGAVDSPAQRRAADRIALLVPGVQELSSNLVVTTAAGARRVRTTSWRIELNSSCTRRRRWRSRMYRSDRRTDRSSSAARSAPARRSSWPRE
jgi:osmotically-inducible protein OsmY